MAQPEIAEKINVVRWDFIKLMFKYKLIVKLDYDISSICDLEKFYDTVFELNLLKYEQEKKPSIFDSAIIESKTLPKS